MNADAATLARRFARTLEQLRTSYDVQYVGTRPLPEPLLDAGAEDDETIEGEATASDQIARSTSAASSVPSTSPMPIAHSAATTPATSTPSAAPSAATAPTVHPTSTAPSISPAPTTPSASAAPTSHPTSATSHGAARSGSAAVPTGPEPSPSHEATFGPADRSLPLVGQATSRPAVASAPREPDPVDRRALREQAQRWSPARKLEYLRVHNVGDCQRCPLSRTRNHIVFGVGNPQAEVMFVGEAPGADEDRQGEPFVGRAGQLLNQWLVQLGLVRDDVYIANVLKCRPPGNRDPRPEEVDRCSPFLQAQIRAIEPKVIVALGRHAGMLLSRREDLTLRAMRSGRLHYDAGTVKGDPSTRVMIPLVVTYHPAYVLRQEGDGRPSAPGQASPTELVMTDLRRALTIAREGA
jgi:uracil-DNA glycosylase